MRGAKNDFCPPMISHCKPGRSGVPRRRQRLRKGVANAHARAAGTGAGAQAQAAQRRQGTWQCAAGRAHGVVRGAGCMWCHARSRTRRCRPRSSCARRRRRLRGTPVPEQAAIVRLKTSFTAGHAGHGGPGPSQGQVVQHPRRVEPSCRPWLNLQPHIPPYRLPAYGTPSRWSARDPTIRARARKEHAAFAAGSSPSAAPFKPQHHRALRFSNAHLCSPWRHDPPQLHAALD